MKVKVLLPTFLLVLEVVKTMQQYNLTVCESNISYHFNQCKKELSTCKNQNCNNGCEKEKSHRRRNTGSASQCEELFVCEDISLDPTFSSTPSCPIVIPTKWSSFTTDASTNSIIPSTIAQQGIQKAMDSPIPTVTSGTSNKQMCSGLATKESITQAALGATVGLLSVLLILAIIGWVCTCVILRKKGTMNMDKTNNRYVKCHTYMTGVLHVYSIFYYDFCYL